MFTQNAVDWRIRKEKQSMTWSDRSESEPTSQLKGVQGVIYELEDNVAEAQKVTQFRYGQFGYKMKYVRNDFRVWFTPEELRKTSKDRVLREAPTQKDKWYSVEALVLTYPPLSDEKLAPDLAQFFFRGTLQEERYPDPEVQGCKIALVEVQQQSVQKPPGSLDPMHSSFLKQVAYNQRVVKAEDAIASIKCSSA
jgi:hypothetical protein